VACAPKGLGNLALVIRRGGQVVGCDERAGADATEKIVLDWVQLHRAAQHAQQVQQLVGPGRIPVLRTDEVELAAALSAALARTVLEPTLDDRPAADFVGPDLGRDACEQAVADRKRPPGLVVGRGQQRALCVRRSNSPLWPFVLATTSVGQEGLDFQQHCHAVVHWNLPSNPVVRGG
jgi:hypothetical protein